MDVISSKSLKSSAYQISAGGSCGDTVTTSGLPIERIPRQKIHCILPSSPWLADSKTNVPLGVLYIAGLLRNDGHEVVVTSMLDKRYEGNIHLPDHVMDSDVHMFGFCTPQFGEALELAAYIRKRNPRALLVAGGPHPSYEPKEVAEAVEQDAYHFKGRLTARRNYGPGGMHSIGSTPLFDTVVVMEGERVTLQLLTDWYHGQLQRYYYGDKADAMDLDVIPFPAWDLLPQDHICNDGTAVMKKRYKESSKWPGEYPVMSMIGTRGCFPAGTQITLANGTTQPVELVREGDLLRTFDPETGELGANLVLQARVRNADDLYKIDLEDGTAVHVTGEHPLVTARGWQPVAALHPGDDVRRVHGDVHPRPSEGPREVLPDVLVAPAGRATDPTERGTSEATRHLSRVRVSRAARVAQAANWEDTARAAANLLARVRAGGRACLEAWRPEPSEAAGGRSTDRRDSALAVRCGDRPRVEGALARGADARAGLLWAGEQARTALRRVADWSGTAAAVDGARQLLGGAVRVWSAPLPGLHSHGYALASSGALQWPTMAPARGDGRAARGLSVDRVECPECVGRVHEAPAPGSHVGLGDRVPGDWIRVVAVTFVGHARVYPLTVAGHATFVAAGIAVHNCPYKCDYCSTPWIGQKPRYRSAANQIAELRLIFDAGVRQIKWQDDTYTLHRTKLRELAEAIHAEFGDDTFASRVHTRVNTLDDHVAESLRMMSAKVCCFGIESGSQRVLDANHKNTTVKQNTDALKKAKEHGLKTVGFLVAGLAGETLETAKETLDWLESVRPYLDYCNLAVGIPYPGSNFWTKPSEVGIEIVDYNFDNQWIVGFSARDEIIVRPYGCTYDEMFQVKNMMFNGLVDMGYAKAEWDEDVRIQRAQDAAATSGVLGRSEEGGTAAGTLTYAGH